MKLTPIEKKLKLTKVEESKTDKLISALVDGIKKTNTQTKELMATSSTNLATAIKKIDTQPKINESVKKLTGAVEKTNTLTRELIASNNSIVSKVVQEISRQPKTITPEIIFPEREKRTMEIKFFRTAGQITKARVEEL